MLRGACSKYHCSYLMLGGLLTVAAGGTIDCSSVVSPIDTPPIRSPLAVHTALARRISGKRLVEIGTRNGDGMDCFARVSSKATAVEMSVPYCKRLRRRARALRASGAGDFKVVCQAYQNATPADADIITWWQQAPHLQNEDVLLRLRTMQQQGFLRSSAQAIIIFDEGWPNDMKSFARLRPEATWVERVPFDERALCFRMLDGAKSFSETCERAFGAFMILGIRLSSTAGAPPAVGEPDRLTQTRCSPLSKTKIRVAACFFGLSRNLAATLPSIQSNLLEPLKATANGFVDVFVHALLRSSLVSTHAVPAAWFAHAAWFTPSLSLSFPLTFSHKHPDKSEVGRIRRAVEHGGLLNAEPMSLYSGRSGCRRPGDLL